MGSLRIAAGLVAAFVVVAIAGVDAVKRPKVQPFSYDKAVHPNVHVITQVDFRERVMDPTLPTLVQFFDPRSPSAKDFAEVVNTACGSLASHVLCNAMDASSDEGSQILQMFTGANKPALPATLLFNPEMLPVAGGQEGQYMKFPAIFGGKKDVATLVEWALEFSAGHEIDRLEDLVDWKDFIAKSAFVMDLPKFILVTSSNVTSPLFKTLAHEFRYGGAFAAVHSASLAEAQAAYRGDATATLKGELMALFGIGAKPADAETLPVIVVATGAQNSDFEIFRPIGGITGLKTTLAAHAWPLEKRKEAMSVFLEEASKRRKREAAEAKMNQALPPITAYDAATFEEHCVKRGKGICAAVFVENPEDETALAWMQAASRKMAQRVNTPSRLVVINGPQQPELAQFFEASGMGFPTVVFINPSRKHYHNLIGSFSERGIVNFYADRVVKGKGKPFDPKKVPAFVDAAGGGDDDDSAAGGGGGHGGDSGADEEEILGDL